MAHISGHRRMQSRLVEHVMQQMRHRGFAVSTCDANPRAMVEGLPCHGHFTSHGDAVITQLHQGGMVPGNPWADHDLLNLIQPALKAGELQRAPQFGLDALVS